MGVKVRVHGFLSPEAAEVAGKTALTEFLEGLSIEESSSARTGNAASKSLPAEQAGENAKSACLHLVDLCHEPSDHLTVHYAHQSQFP
jgi:hypothetical protein